MEDQPVQTPMEDLINDALDHYKEASAAIHHWNSIIPRALEFYLEHHEEKVEKIKEVRPFGEYLRDHNRRIDALEERIDVYEKLLSERDRLLDAIPECPAHGKCVPHAIEWIESRKKVDRIIGRQDNVISGLEEKADMLMDRNEAIPVENIMCLIQWVKWDVMGEDIPYSESDGADAAVRVEEWIDSLRSKP